jgi:beta-xylosidase
MEKRAMKHKSYKAILTILDPEENTMDEKEYEIDIKGGSLNDIEASVVIFGMDYYRMLS